MIISPRIMTCHKIKKKTETFHYSVCIWCACISLKRHDISLPIRHLFIAWTCIHFEKKKTNATNDNNKNYKIKIIFKCCHIVFFCPTVPALLLYILKIKEYMSFYVLNVLYTFKVFTYNLKSHVRYEDTLILQKRYANKNKSTKTPALLKQLTAGHIQQTHSKKKLFIEDYDTHI